MALNPQITKSYASGDNNYMFNLIYQGARLSYYILLLLCIPVILNTHYILVAWLKLVPEHTVLFVQLTLFFAMSESISNPLVTAMLATGKIRNYQIVVGGLQMLNLPIAYLCLYFGAMPESIVLVAIVISQCCLAARLFMLRRMIGLQIGVYLRKVYLNVLLVTLFALIIPALLHQYLLESFTTFLILSLLSIVCTSFSCLYVGATNEERMLVYLKTKQMIMKYKNAEKEISADSVS